MNHPRGPANNLELRVADDQGDLTEQLASLGYSLVATGLNHLEAEIEMPALRQVLIVACPSSDDGTGLIRRARSRRREAGIIVATRNWSVQAEVAFLDAGADRCLPLPCEGQLIQASINALVRRLLSDWSPHDDAVHLSPGAGILRIGCRVFELRRTEYRLCEYLVLNRGRWVSERELLRNVLEMRHDRETSLVRVHIRQIRKAFGDLRHCVVSKRGQGYQFCLSEVAGAAEGVKKVPLKAGSNGHVRLREHSSQEVGLLLQNMGHHGVRSSDLDRRS